MTLRLDAPLYSALERRAEALREVEQRAERVASTTNGFFDHLQTDADERTNILVLAVAPDDEVTRTPAGRRLGLPARDVLGETLREEFHRARNLARAHGCGLDEVESEALDAKTELESVQSHGKELARSADRLARDPTFRRLCAAGFSDGRGFSFWKFSAHRLRREAHVVIERFGPSRGVDTFDGLRSVHAANLHALSTLEGESGRLKRRHEVLSSLVDTANQALEFQTSPTTAIAKAWRAECRASIERMVPSDFIDALCGEKSGTDDDERARALRSLARQTLGSRARCEYFGLARAHLVERTRGAIASDLHDTEQTLDTLRHGGRPHVEWPDAARVDVDTGEMWQRSTDELDRFERIRDALVSFTDLDALDATKPIWDQIIDFDPGDFIDALVMQRALGPATERRPSQVSTWNRAATAAAERFANALANLNDGPLKEDASPSPRETARRSPSPRETAHRSPSQRETDERSPSDDDDHGIS